MKSKNVLASQRSLQYRNEQIEKHNARLYNCSTIYAARPRVFQEVFYLSLCGCGVGIGLLLPFVNNLPRLQERTAGTETFYIEDNIES
jgi:ribonucleoside-diphosphate reductase alpha chain